MSRTKSMSVTVFSYVLGDPTSGQTGSVGFQFGSPPTINISNQDQNGNTAFPYSGPATGSVVLHLDDPDNIVRIGTQVDLTSQTGGTGWTTYNMLDYSIPSVAEYQNLQTLLLTFQDGTEHGPTGPVGPPNSFGITSLVASADQTFTGATGTVVTLGTVDIASTNTADVTSSGNTVTCVNTGIYNVMGRVNFSGSPLDAGDYQLGIYLNGTLVQGSVTSAGSVNHLGMNIQSLLNITIPNSTVQLFVIPPDANPLTVLGTGPLAAWLYVARIQ